MKPYKKVILSALALAGVLFMAHLVENRINNYDYSKLEPETSVHYENAV
jgi:hypothetical protein